MVIVGWTLMWAGDKRWWMLIPGAFLISWGMAYQIGTAFERDDQ
jgi:hypothetical protein